MKFHHRASSVFDLLPLRAEDLTGAEGYRRSAGQQQLQLVAAEELVALREQGVPLLVAFLDNRDHVGRRAVGRFPVMLSRIAKIEAGAVRAVTELLSLLFRSIAASSA